MENSILHSFDEKDQEKEKTVAQESRSFVKRSFIIAAISGIILGSLTGAGFVYFKKQEGKPTSILPTKREEIKKTAGIKDLKLFPDSAEGILREGGIDGEGSFHLERPGGKSQYVYLTSSTIDLSQFVGKKVRVWGKTYKAEKAGWLMDVGYLEVLK